MPKKKRPTSRAVEDRFLDAAARLFQTQGFEATTVREIAKAARMLPGSLHYRYPTKDALLLALMKRGEEQDMLGIRAAIRDTRDPVERLRLALRARLRFLLFGAINGVALWYRAEGPRTPDEISDAFWGFIAYGVVNEAHRPDDIGSALRTLSALEMGAGGAGDHG